LLEDDLVAIRISFEPERRFTAQMLPCHWKRRSS